MCVDTERQVVLSISTELLRIAVKRLDSIGEHNAAFRVLEAMTVIDKLAGSRCGQISGECMQAPGASGGER